MGLPYEHATVERRWQARWAADRVHEVDLDTTPSGRAFYNLVEFPYPSAEGLHIGHAQSYTGADVLGRYQRRATAGSCSNPSGSTPSASTPRTTRCVSVSIPAR
jgi:leucyl-tRNA synthetase